MGIGNVITLLSGVALFLFGMLVMGDGLKKVAGSKMKDVLYKLTGNPLKGFLLGTGVTTVIQSSSATSVMVVGFVNSGMMKVKQGISVVMGAILGTSVTAWVLCLSDIGGGESTGWVSLISTATLTGVIAVIGIIFRMFCKGQTQKYFGDILLGFAVLMFGMSAMSGAVAPLKDSEAFINLLTTFSNPILGVLAGCLFTAVIQSASAAIGILQALAVTGILDFSAAFPLILGISVGAAVPVLVSSIGTSTNGKRTAFVYLLIEVIGVIILIPAVYLLNAIVPLPIMSLSMTMVSIAILNTATRLVTVLVQLPFAGSLEKILCKIFKDSETELETAELSFLEDNILDLPSVAVGQCHNALSSMAQRAQENVHRSLELITHFSDENHKIIQDKEKVVDEFFVKLGDYLVKLAGRELTPEQSDDVTKYLLALGEFERIGDRAVVFSRVAENINKNKIVFSDEAIEELKILREASSEILSVSISAFTNNSLEDAYRVIPLKELIGGLCSDIKMRHVIRARAIPCDMYHITAFNDILTNYERMTDLCANIALGLIQTESESFDVEEYLKSVTDVKSVGAQRFFNEYRSKYTLPKQTTPACERVHP